MPKQLAESGTPILRQDIGTVLGESSVGLLTSQPFGAAFEPRVDSIGIEVRQLDEQRRHTDGRLLMLVPRKGPLGEDRERSVRHGRGKTIASEHYAYRVALADHREAAKPGAS